MGNYQKKDHWSEATSDPYRWSPIYKEFVQLIGVEATVKIYQEFRGCQITFPMRLIDSRSFARIIESEYNGSNLRQLAQGYGYSERHLQRIIKSMEKALSNQSVLNEENDELHTKKHKSKELNDGK